jgi:hypothetical protein
MGFTAILHVGKCNITPKMHYFAKKCHKNGISKMKCVKKCNFSDIKKCLPLHPLIEVITVVQIPLEDVLAYSILLPRQEDLLGERKTADSRQQTVDSRRIQH